MPTMFDGPKCPIGGDAYAGYVNQTSIGAPNYQALVQAHPHVPVLSITTDGSEADCADVETGAMASWEGYLFGYCAVSRVNDLVAAFGRPTRLWTAHAGKGPHICSPECWPGLCTTADGTQWAQNVPPGYDESLISSSFFDPILPPPLTILEEPVYVAHSATRQVQVFDNGTAFALPTPADGSALTGAPLKLPYVGPFSEEYIDALLGSSGQASS